MDAYREANRALWNAWTRINLRSAMYDVEAFAAGRGRDLDPVARAGPGDVRGKSLLHLQCHFGMDTIRWARHGATVTGVDFSEESVTAARALAARMGVPATFVHCDLYDLPATLAGRFDVVFTSHGVLGWLPDLDRWAQVIAHFLSPGGIFYIVEAHPLLQIFDDRVAEPALRLLYPYFHGPEPVRDEHPGCYSTPDAPMASVEHVWLHTLSDLITRSPAPGCASPRSTSTRSWAGGSFRGWSRARTAGGGCPRTRGCLSAAGASRSCSR